MPPLQGSGFLFWVVLMHCPHAQWVTITLCVLQWWVLGCQKALSSSSTPPTPVLYLSSCFKLPEIPGTPCFQLLSNNMCGVHPPALGNAVRTCFTGGDPCALPQYRPKHLLTGASAHGWEDRRGIPSHWFEAGSAECGSSLHARICTSSNTTSAYVCVRFGATLTERVCNLQHCEHGQGEEMVGVLRGKVVQAVL